MDESFASIAAGDDIRPYKIHVSSKYLELTKKKLELTRLPHEILLPPSREWEQGTPKNEIEPLIDFWLEEYSWRDREAHLNATLSQYRTAISVPGVPAPLRAHFIHIKSPHANAIPLLLVPPFPLTNLSLIPLIAPLTDPTGAGVGGGEGEGEIQPFHIVIPSIPGLGFSDAFTFPPSTLPAVSGTDTPSVLESTAYIFNALMLKLSYPSYLASCTGSSAPAVDYQIPRFLVANHGTNCVGIHLIDPPVEEPRLAREPWTWTKFAIARFFHAPIFGYVAEDWKALTGFSRRQGHSHATTSVESDLEAATSAPPQSQEPAEPESAAAAAAPTSTSTPARNPSTSRPTSNSKSTSVIGLSAFGVLSTPNTLSYALCDSPVGLLSLVLAGLKAASPSHSLSQTEIIDATHLAWLPGPEGAMRFWSSAVAETKNNSSSGILQKKLQKGNNVAAAVTTFLGEEGIGYGSGNGKPNGYCPPIWAETRHRIMWTKRREGSAGLIIWERPDVVVDGVRGLAKAVLKSHPELKGVPEVVPMTGVVVSRVDEEEEVAGGGGGGGAAAVPTGEGEGAEEGGDMQMDVESPDTVVLGREL